MDPQDQRSNPHHAADADAAATANSSGGSQGDLNTEIDLLGDNSAELSREEYEKLLDMYDDVAERVLFPVPKDPANDAAARMAIEKLQGG